MESDEDDTVPMVRIGDQEVPLSEVNGNEALIARMTPDEKERYIQLFQEYYGDEF